LQDFIVCLGSFLEHHDGVITAVATVFLMIITGGLVWVGYRQIVTTRAQLRAYVLPDVAGILDGMMLTPNDPARANMPGIGLTIKNFGQTPAYDVISWAQIAVINITDEEKQIVPTLQKIGAATIGTGGTINKFLWFGRALTAYEMSDVGTGVRAIYIFGRIEYRDIFKRHKGTNFRFRYSGVFPPPPNAIMNISEKGNSAD
jgi:hypothetical protein